MRKYIQLGAVPVCLFIFWPTATIAQHCQPFWTAQYKCAMGCGCGGGGGAAPAPVYRAPAPPQPSREELLQRQATALNNQAITLFNQGKFREAIRLFETSLKVFPIQKVRENLGKAYNQLAVENYNQGNYKEASKYAELANRYKPGDKQISSNLDAAREQAAGEARNAALSPSLDRLAKIVTSMQAATSGPGLNFDNPSNERVAAGPSGGLGFLPANNAVQDSGRPTNSAPVSAVDARTPPPNPTLPRVAEIESSPAADEARRAFQAIVAKDWPVAIVWYKQALLKDPNNAALKRSLELAEYTQARRLEIARQSSPMFDVLDIWASGDNQTALGMLSQVEKDHPELKGRIADVRRGLLAVEKYRQGPDYRANMAKMAKASNELMLDGALDMAQRSMIDEYVDKGLRYMSAGDVPGARLMLKTALASDDHRGDVRALLDIIETLDTSSSDQHSQTQTTPSAVHN